MADRSESHSGRVFAFKRERRQRTVFCEHRVLRPGWASVYAIRSVGAWGRWKEQRRPGDDSGILQAHRFESNVRAADSGQGQRP